MPSMLFKLITGFVFININSIILNLYYNDIFASNKQTIGLYNISPKQNQEVLTKAADSVKINVSNYNFI